MFSLFYAVHKKKAAFSKMLILPLQAKQTTKRPRRNFKREFPKARLRITALQDKNTAFLLRNTLRILKGMQKKIGNKKHMLRTSTAVRKGADFEFCMCFALKLYAAFIQLVNYRHTKSYDCSRDK